MVAKAFSSSAQEQGKVEICGLEAVLVYLESPTLSFKKKESHRADQLPPSLIQALKYILSLWDWSWLPALASAAVLSLGPYGPHLCSLPQSTHACVEV